MLTFVPHVRDLDPSEEAKYNNWLKKLEEQDRQSGFKPIEPSEKLLQTVRTEISATISLYLEQWLNDLAIPGCDKSALVRYFLRDETAFTPRQRTNILKSHCDMAEPTSLEVSDLARMFTEAFHRVFSPPHYPPKRKIELRDVLLLDEAVDNIMEPRPTVKDGVDDKNVDSDEDATEDEAKDDLNSYLERYWNLGCGI